MAALDFPASPAVNQLFAAPNGVTYMWTGVVWIVYSPAALSGAIAAPTYDSTSALMSDGSWAGANSNAQMPVGQGVQVFSRSFTASDPTHPIEVDITLPIGNGGAALTAGGGLFIDGGATAVAQAAAVFNAGWMNSPIRIYWQGILAAGAHTFSVRFGANAANGWLNGNNGAAIGGGSQRATMTIREIGIGPAGPVGPQGPPGSGPVGADFFATGTGGALAVGAMATVVPATILTGNSGAYYNSANGRWTPPAGRYILFGWIYGVTTAAAGVYCALYKNGSPIPNVSIGVYASAASAAGNPSIQAVVDANGTDYFELRGQCSAATNIAAMGFGATPTQGLVGPQGPSGPSGNVNPPTYDENATWGALTGTFPGGDVVPLVTGGNRVFQRSFTALAAAHRIRVKTHGSTVTATAFSSAGSADGITVALFIDNTCVRSRQIATNNIGTMMLGLEWEGVLAAGAHTYEVRIGCGASNCFINGSTAGRACGGTQAWTLTIEELAAP